MEITLGCLTTLLQYQTTVNSYSMQLVTHIAITIKALRQLITKHVDKYLINKYNNIKEGDRTNKTYISLGDALYDCFRDDIGTDREAELHEDVYVKKKLREFIGAKEYKKMDALDEKLWYEAWREFDMRTYYDRTGKEDESGTKSSKACD